MFSSSAIAYIALGGVAFAVLGAVANLSSDEKPTAKSIMRDTIAGAGMVSFLTMLVPDMFPTFPLTVPALFSGGGGSGSLGSTLKGSAGDYDLMVGLQRR